MPCTSKILILILTGFITLGLIGAGFEAAAKDKKVEKKDKKDDKKDPKDKDKKEEKIEKKEPFKPDQPAQEFRADDKEKSAWVYAVAFSNDGKSVAASYRNHSIKIWDLAAKKAQVLKGPDAKGLGDFKSILYTDSLVYVGTGKLNKIKEKDKEKFVREGEIRVYDTKSGKPGKSIAGHSLNVEGLAISKDGKFLASASDDSTVKIWDLAKGAETQTIKGHGDTVTSVRFSPDGKQVVTTSKDRTLKVWDISGAKEIASFKVEREAEVKDPKAKDPKAPGKKVKETGREFTCAVFTHDGKKIIAGNLDGEIKVYDVEGKKEVQEMKAHDGVWALALSADGSKIATGGYDGTIKIWTVGDAKPMRSIKAHADSVKNEPVTVTSVSFSPNGEWLASGGIDGLVKIWSLK